MVHLDQASNRLSGQRLTSQRALLWHLIEQTGGHLDADELFRRAKEMEPRISLSTVYRNLKLFKQMGLIDELHFAEEHHHYEAKPGRRHFHLVCQECGKVVEFESPLTQQLREEVAKTHRFDIVSEEVTLTGYCLSCRRKRLQQ